MLAAIFAFLGSLVNLLIDTIFKIAVWMVVLFLGVIVIAAGFVTFVVWLLQ